MKPKSSPVFVLAMVLFDNEADMAICDKTIEYLKEKKGIREFHFANDPYGTRNDFLETIQQCQFSYYGFVLDKHKLEQQGKPLRGGKECYNYCFRLLFENAVQGEVTLFIDKREKRADGGLKKYLMNEATLRNRICDVKTVASEDHNLIQLTDYIAGTIYYEYSRRDSKSPRRYRNKVLTKEKWVRVWPH